MSAIVAVHGIGQQQRGPSQLLDAWRPALRDGLFFAAGRDLPAPPLRIAFYGNVFLPRTKPATPGGKGTGAPSDDLTGLELDDAELEFVMAAAAESFGIDPATGEEPVDLKGTGVPRPVAGLIGALDRVLGTRSAAVLFVSDLRQVHWYLRNDLAREAVDVAVDAAINPRVCRVLIGHSLGSVVAAEYLRRHPGHRLELFLTIGSPLASRLVRDLLSDKVFTGAGVPANVARWVNLRDKNDPVAACGPMAKAWPGVVDVVVDNGRDAHSAVRYLSKQESGQAILAALPELAHPATDTQDGREGA